MSAPMKKAKQARQATNIPANGKGTGVRYKENKKAYILSWYRARLKAKPYGAITETCKHFKISYTALMNWLKPISSHKAPANNGPAIRALHKAMKANARQQLIYQKLLKALN